MTDDVGTVKRRYAYDPWGKRRDADNWNIADNGANLIINRGYTGHEHLDAFGIINMNGRVYDPYTASFFSPDPFIQSGGDWKNYNRYSYCMNNPTRYTDPSGYIMAQKDYVWFDSNASNWMSYASGGGSSALKDWSDHQGPISYNDNSGKYEYVSSGAEASYDAAKYQLYRGSTVFGSWQGSVAQEIYGHVKDGYNLYRFDFSSGYTSYAASIGDIGKATMDSNRGLSFSNNTAGMISISMWGEGGSKGGSTETVGYFNDVIGNFGSGMSKLSGTFRLTDGLSNGSNLSVKYYSSGWAGGSRAGISTYSAASWGSKIGKGSILISVGFGAYNIYNGIQKDGGTYGVNAQVATGQAIGGIGGGMAGAEIGAAIGVWFGGVGAIPGAIIGGAIGGWVGSEAGEETVLQIR